MASEVIKLKGGKKSIFKDKVMALLPDGGNLNLCLTCGLCASGCPATGLEQLGVHGNICAWPLWGWMRNCCPPTGPGCAPCVCAVSTGVP